MDDISILQESGDTLPKNTRGYTIRQLLAGVQGIKLTIHGKFRELSSYESAGASIKVYWMSEDNTTIGSDTLHVIINRK